MYFFGAIAFLSQPKHRMIQDVGDEWNFCVVVVGIVSFMMADGVIPGPSESKRHNFRSHEHDLKLLGDKGV
jgi:hypothetical protein